jgi:nucleoside 2-deoxyribosyltransferase
MAKIYIAAKFERRADVRPYAAALWELGHEIVSTWLNEASKPEAMSHSDFFKKLAIKDLAEVQSADIVLVDTFMPAGSGGSQVEYGYALGKAHKNEVYIVGPKRSVFHELADGNFETWDDVIVWFNRLTIKAVS